MTNHDIIAHYAPVHISIAHIDLLYADFIRSKLLVYGEIHGAYENASVIYTLVRELGVTRIAIEASPAIKPFIDAAIRGEYDFSLIDSDVFEASVVSLEVAKTLATLVREKIIDEITYIDTYFDGLTEETDDSRSTSPRGREQAMAHNVILLDSTKPTLCLMGRWHTEPEPVLFESAWHTSTLYRIRQIKPNAISIRMRYREGRIYNAGQMIELPFDAEIGTDYQIVQKSKINFELQVPAAHEIELEKYTE